MALVLAYEDAKVNQTSKKKNDSGGSTGVSTRVPFFGSRDTPDVPHAALGQWEPGRLSRAHFHENDQFQVVVSGKGRLGRHDLAAYSVHFSRAYTPYGPLSSDPDSPLSFFVMRPRFDPGSQRLPREMDKLKRVPDRRPWQITQRVSCPALPSGAAAISLQSVPEMRDDLGLAVYTLSMRPNAQADAPDASRGEGQYLIVVRGSLWHAEKEHKALALVWVYPKEGAFRLHAGAQGVEAIVLNFPRSETRTAVSAVSQSAGYKTWQCQLCAFVYDEAAGLPADGIAPGTRWEDVPATWNCPDCSTSKADFQMIEV